MVVTNGQRTIRSPSVTPPSQEEHLKTTMSLRKSATFHSSPPSTPKASPPLRRSNTSHEDVVKGYVRRAALTIYRLDRELSGLDLNLDEPPSFRDEANPVPEAILNHTIATGSSEDQTKAMTGRLLVQEPAEYKVGGHSLRSRQNIRRPSHHASDSGLGSSVMSGSRKRSSGLTVADDCSGRSVATASAITQSAAAHKPSLPRLGQRATSKIREYILRPILAKSSLQDFHPVVKDCPRKIRDKEILCLRDLEKTLILTAPETSKTTQKYLDFCLTSVRCIQATVEYLDEREQIRPHDRPYTNGYFVDLVDQIRSYAQQVQASKEKEAKGEPLDEMDVEGSEEVKIYGGVARNGRPAELVRVKKNGKAISIATGEQVKIESIEEDEKDAIQMKRSLSEEAVDDEAIRRSMARRKRSASAAELAPKKCREPGCTKEFKRSCDLTKHEKTHSRPWKCPEELCKYHEYGWPTEKELDRHINDKHSVSPILYRCQFAPCPYKSKRESNCKQHMEKSHNWVYVRSKNNGKNRSGNSKAGDAPPLLTPQTLNHRTPDGSNSPDEPMPVEEDYERPDVVRPYFDPALYVDPGYPQYLPDFAYDNGSFISPVESNNTDQSSSSSENASPFLPSNAYVFPSDNLPNGLDTNLGNGTDFRLFDDIYNARVQIPTPVSAFQPHPNMGTLMGPIQIKTDQIPHISPGGHGNTMLYTPTSLDAVDDSFEHIEQDKVHLGGDFQLFSNANEGIIRGTHQHGNMLFGEIPSTVAGFSQCSSQEFFQAFYAPHNTVGTEWFQPDEGYSGGL